LSSRGVATSPLPLRYSSIAAGVLSSTSAGTMTWDDQLG
jgi:hypothetical protein